MKNTKKNYIILAAVVGILTLAYYAVLEISGFTIYWSTFRAFLFWFITWALAMIPLVIVMKVYSDVQARRDEAIRQFREKREGNTSRQ